jgi:putative ABC transport system substrate-binding protein
MNNRRRLMIAFAAGLAAAARVSHAQPTRKVPQVGYVGNASPSLETALVEGFRLGLRERGYIEGKTIEIQYRWANGKIDAMPAIMAELIALKVDVLITAGTPAALAAKKATATVPIVMAAVGDAVDSGIVPSLARPGGNITGLSTLYTQLEGKRIQILHELVPKLKHIALLANPANPFTTHMLRSALAATKSRHLTTQVYEVSAVSDFDKIFAAIAKSKPDAMAVLADRPFLVSNRQRIVEFAAQNRLPAMYPFSEFMDDGGLVFYGPNFPEMFRRAATYVDKIIKGAKPADLPLEQPTRFEFIVNAKTAKALGLIIPQSLMISADKVIE